MPGWVDSDAGGRGLPAAVSYIWRWHILRRIWTCRRWRLVLLVLLLARAGRSLELRDELRSRWDGLELVLGHLLVAPLYSRDRSYPRTSTLTSSERMSRGAHFIRTWG